MRRKTHDCLQDVLTPSALDGVRPCEEICTYRKQVTNNTRRISVKHDD